MVRRSAKPADLEERRNQCIHQLFEAQVEWTPDSVAVIYSSAASRHSEEKQLTYRELNRRANQIAHYLQKLGVGPEALIGIYMERSVEFLVAILAVLKAGGAYVPLDPSYPKRRLAFMLEDSRPWVVLTQQTLRPRVPVEERPKTGDRRAAQSAIRNPQSAISHPSPVPSLPSSFSTSATRPPSVICLDSERCAIARESDENPKSGATPRNLAYVIYTSGSTGRPKGVEIQHDSLANYNEAARAEYALRPADRVLQFASMSFDASVEEIFPTLTSGATLALRTDAMLDPSLLLKKSADWELTVLSLPTAFWHELTAVLIEKGLELPRSLRMVIIGGERALPQSVAKWRKHVGRGVRLVNTYGPTEATVIATLCDLTERDTAGSEIPIGRPIANTQIHLMSAQGEPVPVGKPGELCIGGVAVSRGYLGRPDLTAEKFIPNAFSERPGGRLYKTGDLARRLPDGDIEFLGRVDDQVKIRGFRVEPREIEAALEKHPGIRQVVVLAREDAPGNKQLVAYFVADDERIPTAGELRQFLSARIPDYMVPRSFVMLDALPLLSNGKVDRKALPAPPACRSLPDECYLQPRTELERVLADIWKQVLDVEKVGIYDNFFELGGDSLKGARFINKLQTELGEYVYIVALFDASTVADLARYLCQHYPDAVERNFGAASLQAVEPTRGQTLSNRRQRIDAHMVEQMRQSIPPLPRRELGNGRKNPRVIFVLSPPRSGSTLLRVMLAGHPRLFAPQELDLLSFNTLEERQAARLSGGNVGFLEGTIRAIMEIKNCDAELAKRVMEGYERQKLTTMQFYLVMQEWIGEKILVDKSTSYALDQGILERAEMYFEDPLYIHLVRHPCGMIHSFEEVRMDQVFFREQNLFTTRELAELVWLICHQNILGFLQSVPDCRRHRVMFEDLVSDPRPVMERICRFLGLDFYPDVLEPYKDSEKRMTDGLHAESRMVGDVKFYQHQAIDPGVADRWQSHYHDDFLGDITWQLAESLGYSRGGPAVPDLITAEASKQEAAEGRLDRLLAEVESLSDEEALRLLADEMRQRKEE